MSLDLREEDPNGARFNAIAQSVLFALIGCIVGFVAAGLLVGIGHPIGWLIIAATTAVGAAPLVRWARDRRSSDHVDLFDIDQSLRPLVLRAATATERIERAAAAAPPGPVGDLLDENHRSALAHLKQVELDARSRTTEVSGVCRELDELATESERLVETALSSEPTALHALTERTALVNEALLDQAAGRAIEDRSSEASDGADHAGHGATNDH